MDRGVSGVENVQCLRLLHTGVVIPFPQNFWEDDALLFSPVLPGNLTEVWW